MQCATQKAEMPFLPSGYAVLSENFLGLPECLLPFTVPLNCHLLMTFLALNYGIDMF